MRNTGMKNAVHLLLYMDNMFVANNNKEEVVEIKRLLRAEFDMKELGPARRILGMEIHKNRSSRKLMVTQA